MTSLEEQTPLSREICFDAQLPPGVISDANVPIMATVFAQQRRITYLIFVIIIWAIIHGCDIS